MMAADSALGLGGDAVHVWIAQPDRVRDAALLSRYQALLSDEERAKCAGYRLQRDRHTQLVSRALLRVALSHYAEVAPRHWRFRGDSHGKPRLEDDRHGLRFNLSHTRGMVVCAVARERELGVDVQIADPHVDMQSIARRFFSAREQRDMGSLPAAARPGRFFDLWALKEAYMKAAGLGFDMAMEDIGCHLAEGATVAGVFADISLTVSEPGASEPEYRHCWLAYPDEERRIALCVRSADPKPPALSFYHCVPLVFAQPAALPLEG